MDEEIKIIPGSRICMHFSLSLLDGTEAVSTFGEAPLDFTVGDGTLSKGLELALFGLRPGTDQTLHIDGGEAYGPRDEKNIHAMLLEHFPPSLDPKPGQIVAFSTPDGGEIPGAVLGVGEREAQVDFNHPLAGREVIFRTLILTVDGHSE